MTTLPRVFSVVAVVVLLPLVSARAEDLDATFAALESRWQTAIDELDIPGLSVAVVYNDKVVYAKGFGRRRVDPDLPFTPDTACYIASSTKPFTAFGIMTLVDQGKVNLDAPVKTYLPRFDLPDHDLAEKITVRDLLCHRYGLDNSIITFAEAYTGLWNDDFFFRELPRSSGVKGSWQYSNLHFTIAGRIIEAVTGMPWQEYLRQVIFTPLGMSHSTARASELYAYDNVAIGLLKENGAWKVSSMLKSDMTMHAAGGIGASALDLAQWVRLQMSDGTVNGKRIISQASLAEMFKDNIDAADDFAPFDRGPMGLAWYLGGYRGEKMIHHFGGYVAYAAHVSFMPKHKLGVIALANSDAVGAGFIHQVACDVYDRVLGLSSEDTMPAFRERAQAAMARRAEQRAKVPPLSDAPLDLSKPIKAYTGTFTSDRWGTLVLTRDGDRLVGTLGNLPLTFHADQTDRLTMGYALGREVATFIFDDSRKMNEVRIASYGPYTMVFTRNDAP